MAENGRILEKSKPQADEKVRLSIVKERQNETRQRKLEELKAQALAAQRFKEQKEQERRKRIEELRLKDDIRRQQVEEKKKAITEAERNRLEFIIKRNQEREQRLETKKRHEKSNSVFAFGSSTPRMLEPDISLSFWGHRRATSIQNITSTVSLTRRQSERDLDMGNKKRATSATGLERSGETTPTAPAGCVSGYLGRRRTDLVPTIPSRDSSFSSSRKSLNHSPASSRPSSSLSQQSTNSLISSTSVRQRLTNTPRKPRPASIAVTGITHDFRNLEKPGDNKPPLPKTRKSISKSNDKIILKNKAKSPVDANPKDKQVRNVVQNVGNKEGGSNEAPQVVTVKEKPKQPQPVEQPTLTSNENDINKENVPIVIADNKLVDPKPAENINAAGAPLKAEPCPTDSKAAIEIFIQEEKKQASVDQFPVLDQAKPSLDQAKESIAKPAESSQQTSVEKLPAVLETAPEESQSTVVQETKEVEQKVTTENSENISNEMTASMTKVRLQSEEEAKAALAERRRQIREEAERQAELERQRLEAEAKAELERQQKEEEQIRQLIEQQRQQEQERLKEAIEEVRRQEEEEKQRKEEEQRLKVLKEEAEKKAKEDAERQKAELQERLKNEEKEREARRKRVEAIMLRTRGKNNSNLPSQKSTDDKNENKSEENKINEESDINGTKMEQQTNGKPGSDNETKLVDNIIENEMIKNANSENTMNRTDSLNSNESWRESQHYDTIM